LWKGSGPGSGINDDAPDDPTTPKDFLGDSEAEFRLTPTLALNWANVGVFATASIGNDIRAAIGIRAGY
jgi:hypothetical protein